MTLGMLEILRGGGFTTGGLNFDAKLRRQSIARDDLFHAHIGGMDTMARALLVGGVDHRVRRARRAPRPTATPDGTASYGQRAPRRQARLADLHQRSLDARRAGAA